MEVELAVEVVRVARVQCPAQSGVRAVVHHLADELHGESAPAVLGQHVDVGEIDQRDAVRKCSREADLSIAVVDADDALRLADEPLDNFA